MIKNIELIIYDFDGVMTDNRVLVDENGKEAVFVNRGDGLAVAAIKKAGIEQVIISTEKNKVVTARANKLKIKVMQGVDDKRSLVLKYIRTKKIDPKKVIYVGNDINDLEAMKVVGWPVAPSDACEEVKKIAKTVLSKKGGYGVIRELFDLIKKG